MNDLWQHLAERKALDLEIRGEIETAFGTRGKKALAAIDDHKVMKYLDFFVVEGRTSRYIVEDEFCTCSDFMYRGRTCWHLLAVRIARATGTYQSVDSWYQDQLKNSR
ncbi:MAG: SWIM zinc finger family protein [Methanoregula sp.]|jgi:predicted nucleic acid-binding Zn finger protein|uniref:SWIM zinc finger family protein n=1 Tax=Methanoregula sp. TaxID=2052170 RepID=UPI0025F57973|nr:SWIM zinc finger family protein [Methanoregula sp.]MCK9631853.1 SWIM zinc finger family protein [Methanoregula sp.]